MRTDTCTESASHAYYHADANGNVTYLMNSDQTLGKRYTYDPYGNILQNSGTAANPFCFSSKEYFSEYSLSYYGYRFYSPYLQRWMNRDPIAERGGLNLYRFVNNSPINIVDPFGLSCKDELMKQALLDMDYWARVMRDFPKGSPIWDAAQKAYLLAAQQYGALSAAAAGVFGLGMQIGTIGGSSAIGVLSGSSFGTGVAVIGGGSVIVAAGLGGAVGYGISNISVGEGQTVSDVTGGWVYKLCPSCF